MLVNEGRGYEFANFGTSHLPLKGTVSRYKGRALLFLKTFEINRKT